ncbi:hypothetical protein J1G34_06740 [Pseudomonas sp. Wu6]|uniref:hypothetical protein n=1 Tax=Pseudomonas sp. Wu6 TaxID=1210129 RepID=UPI001CA6438B|nr:hypothetical protein [Pseudomonas sp. Wu6]MBY8928728.1 hypothetical protein [Pseudomonas sp. Wu6]
MNLRKLAIILLLSISATSALAEGGADRLIQRNLEQQQAYLAAQKSAETKSEIAKKQPSVDAPKTQSSSNDS